MRSAGIIFLIVSLILFCSCGSDPKKQEPVKSKTQDTTKVRFQRAFAGKIDNKYDVVMMLTRNGNELSGSYRYKNQNSSLELKGTIDSSGNFSMNEFNHADKITGIFNGKISGLDLKGEWTNQEGSKKLNFEFANKTKRELLKKTVGIYSLTYYSGFAGGSAMFDANEKKGKWEGFSSSLIAGTREGEDMKLSKKSNSFLNSIKIEVDSCLTISLYAEEKLLTKSSFIENGMDYRIKEKPNPKDLIYEWQKGLSPSIIFKKGELILLADDHVDFSNSPIKDFFINPFDNLVLSYSPESDEFTLIIFQSYLAENCTLNFKKK